MAVKRAFLGHSVKTERLVACSVIDSLGARFDFNFTKYECGLSDVVPPYQSSPTVRSSTPLYSTWMFTSLIARSLTLFKTKSHIVSMADDTLCPWSFTGRPVNGTSSLTSAPAQKAAISAAAVAGANDKANIKQKNGAMR